VRLPSTSGPIVVLNVMGGSQSKVFDALMATLPSQQGKVIAITGCTSGVGLAAAKAVASLGAIVVMLNRPSDRATAAVEEVTASVKSGGRVVHIDCDLTTFESVNACADRMLADFAGTGVDALCCNAGIVHTGTKTVDDFDVMMQVNMHSHFLLSARVYPLLQKAASERGDARIVSQSSMIRIGQDLQASALGSFDPDLKGKNGDSFMYQQSKLANVVFTFALHDKLTVEDKGEPSKVKALVAHPGGATSALFDNGGKSGLMVRVMKAGSQSSEDGACGMLTCMCSPDAKSGEFYGPGAGKLAVSGKAVKLNKDIDKNSANVESRQLLWDACVKAVGVDFPFG